jgi:hypothetical protein
MDNVLLPIQFTRLGDLYQGVKNRKNENQK